MLLEESKTVSVDGLREDMLESLGEEFANKDIRGLGQLFKGLVQRLKPEEITLDRGFYSGGPVTDELKRLNVYGINTFGSLAHMTSGAEGPKYDVFVVSPRLYQEGDFSLTMFNVLPYVNPRDFEERETFEGINGVLEKLAVGVHSSCRGELVLPKAENRSPTVVRKMFIPPIKPNFNFSKDIERMLVGTEIYDSFLEFQESRSEELQGSGRSLALGVIESQDYHRRSDLKDV